jgi:hypothetical protein
VGIGGSYDHWARHGNLDNRSTTINSYLEELSRLNEWNPVIQPMQRVFEFLRSTRGNTESAMVLIPLLVLFILGMQVSIAVHARNNLKITAQDEASTRAILGDFKDGDEFLHIDESGDNQNLDLLIVRKESELIEVLPYFLRGGRDSRQLEVQGFAVIENQR